MRQHGVIRLRERPVDERRPRGSLLTTCSNGEISATRMKHEPAFATSSTPGTAVGPLAPRAWAAALPANVLDGNRQGPGLSPRRGRAPPARVARTRTFHLAGMRSARGSSPPPS